LSVKPPGAGIRAVLAHVDGLPWAESSRFVATFQAAGVSFVPPEPVPSVSVVVVIC